MTPTPAPASPLTQTAQLVALANRQRLLQRQAEERLIAKAVAQALKG
jgi:hypothetical protein